MTTSAPSITRDTNLVLRVGTVSKCPHGALSGLVDELCSFEGNPARQEDVYLRRRTCRIKLSKYAAYNTYHHCEQCHQYLGFNPRYQVSHDHSTSALAPKASAALVNGK